MLDALRKGAGTWIAKLFIALLIFSFAIWGVTDFLQGVGQNTAARVGNVEVSAQDFDRAYRQDLNRFGQQLGRPLTPAEGAQLGIPQQVLGRLVAEAALTNAARGLQLGVTDSRLGGIIQSDPAFQGPSGRYDRLRLQQILQSNGYREDEYVLLRRDEAERNQIIEGLAGGMSAPTAYLEALDAYQSETRTVDYIAVTAEQIGTIEDPADDVLATYYEDNTIRFRAPEYREIRFVSLTPASVARPQDIAEEDARTEYNRSLAQYSEPERRKIRQMTFSAADDAEAAASEIAAGKTFDDIMEERELSENDVLLGAMARSDFLDDAIGDAAFELASGETSGVIDGRFATVILNVEDVLPARTTPFEEVRDELVEELALQEAQREILDLFDEIEDARAGGALLDEISDRFQVPLKTSGAFDAAGRTPADTDAILPDVDGLLAGVFDSDIGIENDVLQIDGRGYLWYDVTNVTPARDRELEEVRDAVVDAWKSGTLTARLNDTIADLLAQAEAGTPLADLAADQSVTVQTVDGVLRNTPSGDLGQEAVRIAFDRPVGSVGTAASVDGTARLLVKATASAIPAFDTDAPQTALLTEQVSQQLRDTLLGQFITEQETRAGLEINNAAIAQVIGFGQDGAAQGGLGY